MKERDDYFLMSISRPACNPMRLSWLDLREKLVVLMTN